MQKTQSLELSYQEEEKKRMEDEANYSLDKGEIDKKQYSYIISKINNDYKIIVSKIIS